MKARGYLLLACFSLSLGSVLVGCGDDSGGSDTGGGAGVGGDPSGGSATAGQAVAKANGCAGCHGMGLIGGTTAFGGAYPSNLTPDQETGIGGWTDAQIVEAVTKGIDDEGESLCSSMPKFPLGDDDVTDLVAFLKSLTPVKNQVAASTCQ